MSARDASLLAPKTCPARANVGCEPRANARRAGCAGSRRWLAAATRAVAPRYTACRSSGCRDRSPGTAASAARSARTKTAAQHPQRDRSFLDKNDRVGDTHRRARDRSEGSGVKTEPSTFLWVLRTAPPPARPTNRQREEFCVTPAFFTQTPAGRDRRLHKLSTSTRSAAGSVSRNSGAIARAYHHGRGGGLARRDPAHAWRGYDSTGEAC